MFVVDWRERGRFFPRQRREKKYSCPSSRPPSKKLHKHQYQTKGASYPTRDQDGNLLVTEYGRCRYRDNQLVTLQELPETAPPGQLPHGIDVVLEDDLVDSVKPGDRVAVVGVFRPLAGAANGAVSGVYKSVVVGVAAERLTQDKVRWQPRDVRNIRAVAARPWALQLLARSLAPSIYGHDLVKQGLVLLLMGGIERVVNNTHLR